MSEKIINDIHRIGGGSVENLKLKPREREMNPPGISVLKAPSVAEVVHQIQETFPEAQELLEQTKIVGSSTVEKIRNAGFDLIPNPTRKLPNHYRLIHPNGAAGFSDENLSKLAAMFTDTSED